MTERGHRSRIVCTGEVGVALDAASALALFTPEGERGWVGGWAPRYPEGGVPALAEGLTFQTDKDRATATWLVVRYAPEERRAAYAYVLPGQWATLVDVTVVPVDLSTSRVLVTYHMTSLAPECDAVVEAFAEGFDTLLERWQDAIAGIRVGASAAGG